MMPTSRDAAPARQRRIHETAGGPVLPAWLASPPSGVGAFFRVLGLVALTVGAGLAACSGGSAAVEVVAAPAPITTQECASCGMLVSEQPSPRGQVVYRDGTHAHFCSLGDMLVALDARSPHGSPQGIYVEALPPDFDPADYAMDPLPWTPAESAAYVTGLTRERVMGRPLLSFVDRAQAEQAAAMAGGTVVSWAALKAQGGAP